MKETRAKLEEEAEDEGSEAKNKTNDELFDLYYEWVQLGGQKVFIRRKGKKL